MFHNLHTTKICPRPETTRGPLLHPRIRAKAFKREATPYPRAPGKTYTSPSPPPSAGPDPLKTPATPTPSSLSKESDESESDTYYSSDCATHKHTGSGNNSDNDDDRGSSGCCMASPPTGNHFAKAHLWPAMFLGEPRYGTSGNHLLFQVRPPYLL